MTRPVQACRRAHRFAIHAQITYVAQATNAFAAPYRGPNSLPLEA